MTPAPLITLDDLAALRSSWAKDGARVAFVPTMGALHLGHLSLVQRARQLADRVIVSIFVNPTQFGPSEDFAKYPRTLTADLDLLASLAVEAVFLPNAVTIYPDGFQTYVHNEGMALTLDGAVRPGHFQGVLTIVCKLLNLVQPHVAIFGKKDYQQWRLIERMVADLYLPVDIVGGEILREADGLAMSSRNRYLSDAQRQSATALHAGLSAAKAAFAAGERGVQQLTDACRSVLEATGAMQIDYVEIRRQDLRQFASEVDAPSVLLVAARLAATRLIDNIELA